MNGDDRQDIGRAIRHLRGDRAQKLLASKASIHRGAWSLYETGKRQPGPRNLERILRALGCTALHFEEVAWAFRRRRLAAEGHLGNPRAQPPLEAAVPRNLEDLRARAISVLDELLTLAAAGHGARR